MDVGSRDQLGPMDADERAIPQQVLEPGGAVVGDHEVRGDEIRADVVARRDHSASRPAAAAAARATQSTPPE